MIDYLSLFSDYGVDHALSGKNIGRDYIGVHCPWCDDTSYHGGFPINGEPIFHCWRCGGHNYKVTLAKLLNIKNIEDIVAIYDDATAIKKEEAVYADTVEMVGGELEWYHRQYLESRRYDPDYLIEKYKITGTPPYSDYGARVYFPIFYRHELVSYQGRSIIADAKYRYLVAPQEKEKIFHKHLLYNIDNCKDMAVVVEGIFDVLRLGDGACATFGTSYKPEQFLLLKPFKRIFLLYDGDKEAQEKASRASSMINNIATGEVYVVNLPQGQDPDSLSDDDAKHLMQEFRRKVF